MMRELKASQFRLLADVISTQKRRDLGAKHFNKLISILLFVLHTLSHTEFKTVDRR
jgi:hypothetical protein